MHPGENDQLVVALRAAARALANRRSIRDLEDTLGQIVAAAVKTIPAVCAGSISMTEHGRIETRHPTSDDIRKLDQTQSELREAPASTRSRSLRPPASSWPRTSPTTTRSGGPDSRRAPWTSATAG